MLSEDQLYELKDKVDNAKTSAAEANGRLQSVMKQLKDDHACNTIKEAETKVADMDRRLGLLDKKINDATAELEKTINVMEEE